LAQFYLDVSQPNKSDYAKKYEEILHTISRSNHVSGEQLVKQLKAFRLEQSRKENIKPYYIFNDAQMNDLMEKSPTNKEELLKVSGFGNVKVEKYGESILNILNGN
jgi:superfamily II DNA helicase RecQ